MNDGRMNASRGDDRAASGSAARPARSSSKIPSHARPAPKPHPGGTPPDRPPALPPLDAVVPEDLRVEHTRDTVEYMKNLAPPRITTRGAGASKEEIELARWREEASVREERVRARDASIEDEKMRAERERLAAAWRVFPVVENNSKASHEGGKQDATPRGSDR